MAEPFLVRVPASSANLGPGFDALGMAVSLYAEAGIVDARGADAAPPDGARPCDERHPAQVAFGRAGGTGSLWVRSSIPVGRGLGFSGAVRVAGLVAAHVQQAGAGYDALLAERPALLALASELEGHADNVAASLYGGIVATAHGRAVQVPLAFDPAIVVWIPSHTTSTDESRGRLAASVPFADAVFNIGGVALLLAALTSGDVGVLGEAMRDRLHQDRRMERSPSSRAAMQAATDSGAWCAWLSGSGPTVAAMCPLDDAGKLAACLPADGHAKVLRIDHGGAVIEASG